jgi:uncharacterized protein
MNRSTRNMVIFFIATFVWTWAFYLPIVLSGSSQFQMPWMILLILGGMGPSLVGIAMVFLTYDRKARRDYWQRCYATRRIHLVWWFVIFLIFPAIMLAAIAVDVALGGSLPGMIQLKSLMANPAAWPLAILLSFMSGPFSEEFGWRGYALEPLIKRFGILPGTIGLGFIWAVWHLPLYFMSDGWHAQMGFAPAGFWTFIVFNIALSLIMTWVYLNTDRSILSAMLLHFGVNFSAQLVAPYSDRVEFLRMLPMLVIGLIGCVGVTRKRQVRALLPPESDPSNI